MKRVLVCHQVRPWRSVRTLAVAIPYEAGLGLSHAKVQDGVLVVTLSQSPMKRVLVCHEAVSYIELHWDMCRNPL